VLTGLDQLGGQGHRVVVDADSVKGLTVPSRRTITLRRRCRSMPTYCVVCSTGVSFCRLRVVSSPQVCSAHLVPGDGRTPAGSSLWIGRSWPRSSMPRDRSSCSASEPVRSPDLVTLELRCAPS
jgi:hypothetical protein